MRAVDQKHNYQIEWPNRKFIYLFYFYFKLLCELRMRRLYTGERDSHNYKQIHIIIGF